MMVIDTHTHYTGGQVFATDIFEPIKVIADMDANRIKRNWLLPLDGLVFDPAAENRLIANVVQLYPDHFSGLGTVNPRQTKEAIKEMHICLDQTGMIGMKFHPWLQAFSPLEKSFMDLAAEAEQRRTMFFFHDGTPPYTEPLQIAEVAAKYPDLTVVMGHTGLNDFWRESLLAAQKYDNIWLCFCACPFWGMKETVQAMNGERIIWGSDYPLANQVDTLDRIRHVEYLPCSDNMKQRILHDNAIQLMHMLQDRTGGQS